MKPHARYGHTPHHSTAGGGAGRGGLQQQQQLYTAAYHRRPPGGGQDGVDGGAVIEEYKLEEQLAPFYAEAASDRGYGGYAGGPVSAGTSSSANGVKPALRTVSIMETLSQLTNGGPAAGRRPSEVPKPSTIATAAATKASVPQVVKRKKIPVSSNDSGVTSLLDIPQWYPKRPSRPEQTSATSPRVWDVSRLSSKLGISPGNKSGGGASTIGRSVEHILASSPHSGGPSAPSSTTVHGYGSLERRRRRRPGARGAGLSARRGETDWEREEDEEDDRVNERDASIEAAAHYYHPVGAMVVPGASFQRGGGGGGGPRKPPVDPGDERDRERARQSYKPPSEWFRKKRTQQPLQQQKAGSISVVRGAADVMTEPRGQTPDWIHRIFHVARRGNLLKLVRRVPFRFLPVAVLFFLVASAISRRLTAGSVWEKKRR